MLFETEAYLKFILIFQGSSLADIDTARLR